MESFEAIDPFVWWKAELWVNRTVLHALFGQAGGHLCTSLYYIVVGVQLRCFLCLSSRVCECV